MTYEIENMDCYFMFRNRPGVLNRRRHSDKILWPARADAINDRAEEYCRELNAQLHPDGSGAGNVVFGGINEGREMGEARPDYEQWRVVARQQNDMRALDHKLT